MYTSQLQSAPILFKFYDRGPMSSLWTPDHQIDEILKWKRRPKTLTHKNMSKNKGNAGRQQARSKTYTHHDFTIKITNVIMRSCDVLLRKTTMQPFAQ